MQSLFETTLNQFVDVFCKSLDEGKDLTSFSHIPPSLQTKLLDTVQSLGQVFNGRCCKQLGDYLSLTNPEVLTLSQDVFPVNVIFESLNIENKKITTQSITIKNADLIENDILNLLNSAPNLSTLAFENCHFTNSSIEVLAAAAIRLERLNFTFCQFSLNDVLHLSKILESSDCQLKSFCAQFCFDEESWISITNALAINSSIENLVLESNGITKQGLNSVANMLNLNKSIQSCTLTYNMFQDPGSQELISACLENSTLHRLDLRKNAMNSTSFSAFLDVNSKKLIKQVILPSAPIDLYF